MLSETAIPGQRSQDAPADYPAIADNQRTSVAPQPGDRVSLAPLRNHLPALDGVRGIAILLVLFYHYPAPFAWLRPLASMGWCGVDLFFVLSGYLITGILYSSADKPHYFRNFYLRRSLRIFPLYYGFLVIMVVMLPRFIDAWWLGLETLHGRVLEFFLYYSNYSNVFVGWVPASLGAFWSLAVEEHFYLLWPLFVKVTPGNKMLGWCVVIVLLVLAGRVAIAAFRVSWLAAYYLTTSRVDSLVVGGITAVLAKRYPNVPARWMVSLGCVMLAILAVVMVWRHGLTFNDWPIRTFGYSVLDLFFASVVWLAGNTRGQLSRALGSPVLITFGKYSYSIYIFHMMVLALCARWVAPRLFPMMGWSSSAALPLFAISIAGVLILAYLSWNFYEKPLLSLKERFSS